MEVFTRNRLNVEIKRSMKGLPDSKPRFEELQVFLIQWKIPALVVSFKLAPQP